MAHRPTALPLAAAVLALGLGGCQSLIGEDENQAVAAYEARLARPPSAQRTDESGFPLLGAYPRAAATQLDDATVSAERARLSASAAGTGGAGQAAADYSAALGRAAAVRQDQRLAVDRALSGSGEAGAEASRTPAVQQ